MKFFMFLSNFVTMQNYTKSTWELLVSHPQGRKDNMCRGGNQAGRAGLGRANSGSGQNRAGPKLARFFRAKILTAQPILKTGPIGPNSHFKAKKIRAGRAKFGPVFFGPKI